MEQWEYHPAEDVQQTLPERLRRFPREPDMLVYGLRLCLAGLMRVWLKVYHRLHIQGKENLPANGPFVLVANHASHLDTISLLSALPVSAIHRTFPAAARDYFFESLPKLTLAAVAINAMPFDRLKHVRDSIDLCRHLVQAQGSNNILILFPEGTRSVDGKVRPFKAGIGLVTAGSDVPVVPCYMEGSGKAWPKGAWLPRPRRIAIRIGKPMSFAQMSTGRADIDLIAEKLHAAVKSLGSDDGM